MSIRVLTTALIVSALAWPSNAAAVEMKPKDAKPEAEPFKLLVFSKTKGFRHDSIEVGTQALKEIGKEAGWAVDATEDSTLFNDDTLKKYRAVVWLNTTGDVLDDAQQCAFERFIKAGGGYAGIHSASDTEYDWAWYGKLVGAYFKSHPNQQKAKLNVVDKKHPSTAHLPDVWERFDEWYSFRAAPTHVKVLMKIDEKSYEGGGMDNNHPMCWYHEIDGGRAFYTASGHTKESYGEPDFRKHLLGGLKYAIGDKPLDYSKAPPSEARFERTVISREMKDPMQFTILGDGRIVVVDRMGTVHVIKKDGSSVATEVPIYAVGSGKPNWEDGMIGVAADPDFAKNPYVYILHAVKGDEPKEHLMRYGFRGDQIDIASGKTVLEIKNCRTIIGHCGGGLSFGPDRQLFISTGDNTTPFESDGYSPLDTRVEGKDARATSANSMDLRGKILRIRIKEDGTYEIPKGNLFPVGTPNTRPEIYVMGCRNPFRHHYDPVNNCLLWGEVGPDNGQDSDTRGPKGHDEFNRAKGPGNFGWPLFVGNNKAYAGYDFETKKAGEKFNPAKPLNDSSRNTGIKDLPPAQEPLFWYPSSNSPEFSWLGNGGRCAMGGPLYRFDQALKSEDKFPLYFEGKWFIYEWMRQWIKVVSFDKDGAVTGVEDFAPGIKFKKPMDMKFGPDGALYVLEYGNNWSDNTDSQLSKVVFAGGNRAPLAMAGSDKFVGKDPLTVQFNSDGTMDKDDGDTLTYAWDFGGKGSSADAKPSFTFKEPGVYNVVLTVTDKGGKKSIAGMPIRVGNSEPVVKIVEPKAGAFFAWGQTLPFKVDVSDDEDGSTADGKLSANKIQVSGIYQDGSAPTAKGYEAAMLTGGSDKGRKLIGGSDCLACHQMNAISVGPAFMKIAQKYHKQDVMATLIKKVAEGGQGVWGPMAMAPHPQHTAADIKEMVTWILSLADAPPPMNGATGSLMTPAKPAKDDRGVYIVTATYADAGAKGQASLTGSASVVLRSRYIKAVTCSTNKGAQEEDCSDDGKGKDFGFIDHDDHISFTGIDLSATKSIEARVASAGAGGLIEVHAGSPTGKLVATIEVKPTGDWQKWGTTAAADVTDPGGSNELFFVFKSKSGGGGGLFNLNWVHFVEK